jgi:hypothetical protein
MNMTDDEIRAEWLKAGGSIHGPRVETVTMPEKLYFKFRRSLAPMTNVPNLDNDNSLDLMEFWNKHQNGRRYRDLFPKGGRGTKIATEKLADYAANKAAARSCRLNGQIDTALNYERICDLIYKGLPDYAKW